VEVGGYPGVPTALPWGRDHTIHGIGGWVGLRAGLVVPGEENSICPYQDSYPGLTNLS